MPGIHVVQIPEVMNRDPLCLGPEHTVSDARRFIRQHKVRHIPIVSDPPIGDAPASGAGRMLVGILSERDVLRASPPEVSLGRRPDLDAMALLMQLAQVMSPEPIVVDEKTPLANAAEIMLARKFDVLPVVVAATDRRLVGLLTTSNLIRLLPGPWAIHCRGFASDLMKPRLLILKPTDTLKQAMVIMQSHHIRHVPVSEDGKHLMGMVTDRDVLRNLPPLLDRVIGPHLGTEKLEPFRSSLFKCDENDEDTANTISQPVLNIMTRKLITAFPDTPSMALADLMLRHHCGSVPILHRNTLTLAGLVTLTDLLGLIVQIARGDSPRSPAGGTWFA